LKLLRFDAAAATTPAVKARAQAFLGWAGGTNYTFASADMRKTGFRDIENALVHLESPDGDPWFAAWARLIRAHVYHVYAVDQKIALVDSRRAVQGFTKLGDARSAARARYCEGRALQQLALDSSQKDPTADEARLEATRIYIELEKEPAYSLRERAKATNSLGRHIAAGGDWLAAREHFTRALAQFRAIGDLDGKRYGLSNLGGTSMELGDLQEAARIFDELYSRSNEVVLPERRASYIYNGAFSSMSIGATDRAIERFMALLALGRLHRMQMPEARALDGLGMAYWQRGDLTQAAVFIDEALKVRSVIDDPPGVMNNRSLAGSIARESGETQKALQLHRESMKYTTNDMQRMLGLANIARDHAVANDHDQAVKTYREALSLSSKLNPYRASLVGLGLAESLLARKGRTSRDIDEALALGENALKIAIEGGDITQEMLARKIVAQARAARGELGRAQEEFEAAIALIFRYRAMTASPDQQAAALTHLQATFRGYTDLLMRDVVGRGPGKFAPAGAAEENALRVLESARVTSFDAVRLARVDAATQDRIDQMLTLMAGKRVKLASMLEKPGEPGRDVEALRMQIAKLRTQIDLERAGGATGKADAPPREIARPWPAIATGVTQLSYALGDRQAYLWVRDTSGIRATVLAAPPATIEREIGRVTAMMNAAAPDDRVQALARLSGWLLPEGTIVAGSQQLEIVAEGKLATVPFAALGSPLDRSRRLAQTHSLTMIGSTLDDGARVAAGKHDMRLVALAGFSGPAPVLAKRGLFPELGSTGAEARAIAGMFAPGGTSPDVKLLTGNDGSAEAVKAAWTNGADVFHFATHGLPDLGQPLASLLMLPAVDSAGNTTYLTAGQVQDWRGNANLVYLSACETAVGPARFADGMPGLQRAFLRAGARGVVATLWPIEDLYAGQFAAEFYRRYTSGTAAARALSETQRAWLEAAPGVGARESAHRRMTAWAHVYYTR
jgi:CHAT domain-containing protein